MLSLRLHPVFISRLNEVTILEKTADCDRNQENGQ